MGLRVGALMAVVVVWVTVLSMGAAHFCGEDNCFDILKVKRTATKREIRRSYHKLSQVMHPDKRPGVEKAVEEFRAIGTAYETLINDEKRRTYEDFLDNPLKYAHLLKEKYYYAPKSNTGAVFVILVGLCTLMHWFQMKRNYNVTRERLRESMEFKREVSRLVKTKAAPNKEEAAKMINVDVVGLSEPKWQNLFIIQIVTLPMTLGRQALWSAKWAFNYKIRKLQYSDDDKLYLIQKNLGVPQKEWEMVSEEDKKLYIDRKLWDAEECAEYERLRRIEMNKAGKLKKKKKHIAVPYSEVEEVSM